jgi:hypothetical protein
VEGSGGIERNAELQSARRTQSRRGVLRLKAIREVGWTLRVPGSIEDKRLPLRSTVSQLAM